MPSNLVARLLPGLFLPLLGCVAGAVRSGPSSPELFGVGLFSTSAWDFFLAEAPDGRSALVCQADSTFSTYQIFETRRTAEGRWSPLALPSFAGAWSNADPHFTLDGRTVYFISNRPAPGQEGAQSNHTIWMVSRDSTGTWGIPEKLGGPVGVTGVEDWSPSIAANGDLYFGSERSGGKGGLDLWVARSGTAGFAEPENLGDSINTAGQEVEPWIAPDGSYLIFSARARHDSVGRYDLYLSRRVGGVWQGAKRIDGGVSTPALDFNPSVSPDGVWLYFSSTRPRAGGPGPRVDSGGGSIPVAGVGNGLGDIYRVPLAALVVTGP